MTAYAHTWLQFAFPVNVWFLISMIIIISRYSSTFTRLIGSNPIAVLATLLLISYTKVLKTIIEVYAFAKLNYPNNRTVYVWLKDANVPYLKSWHLFLTVVTTLFVVLLFLPYTFLLLFGYKLYRFSGHKYFHWLNRIKPLLDSYYAPYRKNTRYWTGLLLLIRWGLYTVFALCNVQWKLLTVSVALSSLLVIAWLSFKIYTSFYVNAIEATVYLNLLVLASACSNDIAHSHAAVVVNWLVGTVFFTMICIILHHFHLRFTARSMTWRKITAMFTSLTGRLKTRLVKPAGEEEPLLSSANLLPTREPVSTSEVTLQDPLTDHTPIRCSYVPYTQSASKHFI